MKTLIVAEKKSAAEAFRDALTKHGKFTGSVTDRVFESEKYVITWVQGHLLSLKEPKEDLDWDGREEKWSLSHLPWFPKKYEYKIPKKTAKSDYPKLFKQVSEQMKRKDLSLVICACDAGREGDLIFWELYDFLELSTPVKRFWESTALTEKVVNHVMAHELKEEDFWKPRKEAAYARQFADSLLGMNLTMGFSSITDDTLHLGRVQTPTLAIIVKRENEILAFKEEEYFEIEADFGKYKGLWFKDALSNTRIDRKSDAEAITSKVKGKEGTVIKKEVKEDSRPQPLLYSLTTLQREANKKFGFSSTQTLDIAQNLYDTHKILSYPRTESEVIGEENVKILEPTLRALRISEYEGFVDHILSTGIKTTKRMVNDAELTDHHALIPTTVTPNLSKLTPDEKKIYELVVKRFLAAFYPPAKYEKTEVVTEVEGETFKTSGSILIDPGWKVVYGADALDEEEEEEEAPKKSKGKAASKDKDVKLPPISKGERNLTKDAVSNPKKTKAPKRLSEGDLLGAMINAGKTLDDDDLREAMSKAGLGTAATRNNIIDQLESRGYIKKEGKTKSKKMVPTPLGMELIKICPEELKSPEITAQWEHKLREIENSRFTAGSFMAEIKQYVSLNIEKLGETRITTSFRSLREGSTMTKIANCPECGADVIEKDKVFACVSDTSEHSCFKVFKEMSGKKISSKIVKQLCEGKVSEPVTGFKSKAGKEFSAKLAWKEDDKGEKRVQFEFGTTPKADDPSALKCPFCGEGVVRETAKSFGCSNWQSGCKFTVWNPMMGRKMKLTEVEELVKAGKTKKLKGFTSKAGKEFEASLVLNKGDKKIDLSFE